MRIDELLRVPYRVRVHGVGGHRCIVADPAARLLDLPAGTLVALRADDEDEASDAPVAKLRDGR